jgi:hypothetical protein
VLSFVVFLIFISINAEQQKGGYAQVSVSCMSIQERYGQRVRTVVAGGVEHDASWKSPIEEGAKPPLEVKKDENFPLYENRAIRDDPLDTRHTFPAQALGLMATIDCQTRKKSSKMRQSGNTPVPTTIATGGEVEKPTAEGQPAQTSSGEEVHVTAKIEDEEVVNVIMVTNDVGLDHFNVVMDCDSWCRVIRFALNEGGVGFDPRWYSGDWAELLTRDMMVHPNSPLELEQHIQPRRQLFLDENEFISSDLFNVNARVTNCEVRVPAAIQQNVRSCDIVVTVDETLLTVSSGLPRTFLSGKIGSSISGDDISSDKAGVIDFPNDPSDIAYELEGSEDPCKRQSFMPLPTNNEIVKAKSTFRMQLTLRGLSTRIIPVIPFYVVTEPQELCAPTEMTMIFCFEGEPPETDDSNIVKIVLFASILVHQIHMNCDLDLIAGAVSTCLYHFEVVKETIKSGKKLIPVFPPPLEQQSDEASMSNTEEGTDDHSSTKSVSKIQKSLHGRRVLVRRQFHRSRETGGLRVAFCFQAAEYSFTLWRQNVSMYSPLRPSTTKENITYNRQKLHFPLLKVMHFAAGGVEVGVEVAFREMDRRIIVKCSLSEALLRVCKLNKDAASEFCNGSVSSEFDAECKSGDETLENEHFAAVDSSATVEEVMVQERTKQHLNMIEIFSIGPEVELASFRPGDNGKGDSQLREETILMRCEEQYGLVRSRSFAADIATGGRVNLHVDEMETVFLLVLEALMMPTWSRAKLIPQRANRRFPDSSVGALLLSVIPGSSGRFRGFVWLFRRAIAAAFPEDLRLFLMRVRLGNLLIKIPESTREEQDALDIQQVAVMLHSCDLLTWYFSPTGQYHRDMLSIRAKEGGAWSSLILNQDHGFSHRISSRQSFHVAEARKGAFGQHVLVELVPEFGVECDYLQSKIASSVENTLSFQDTKRLRDCFRFVRRFASRCIAIYFHLKGRLAALRNQVQLNGSTEKHRDAKQFHNPIENTCSDIEQSIRFVRELLVRICREIAKHELDQQAVLRQKDETLEKLQALVFSKEKERVAAVALASSHLAGWLRMGGTHQSGQRVAATSTLWSFWAVLRKEMLILFSGPGNVSNWSIFPFVLVS